MSTAQLNRPKECDLLTSLDTLLRIGQWNNEYHPGDRGFVNVDELLSADMFLNSNMENTNSLICVWGKAMIRN